MSGSTGICILHFFAETQLYNKYFMIKWPMLIWFEMLLTLLFFVIIGIIHVFDNFGGFPLRSSRRRLLTRRSSLRWGRTPPPTGMLCCPLWRWHAPVTSSGRRPLEISWERRTYFANLPDNAKRGRIKKTGNRKERQRTKGRINQRAR